MGRAKTQRNEAAKKLFAENWSYSEIGKFLHISKQRVHQIITSYSTFSLEQKPVREVSEEILKYKTRCNFCGSDDKVTIHYIDGNDRNIDRKNTLPICKECRSGTLSLLF